MRRALFISGLVALAATWGGPLPELAHRAFSAHMLMHMLVVTVAAPLLALGLSSTRLDPVRRCPQLFAPIPLSLLELMVVWGWHAPALHHAARHTTLGFVGEQAAFLGAGLAVWLAVVGGGAPWNSAAPANGAVRVTQLFVSERRGAGVVALLLTSMHMTLLGALLALTPRALYSHAGAETGLTPLEDQQLGGAVMIVMGGLVYLAGGIGLTAGLLRSEPLKEAGA